MSQYISIDKDLEHHGVFRAAWMLMEGTPTGKKTIDLLKTGPYKTEIVPGSRTGQIANLAGTFRLGQTATVRTKRLTTVTIEMDLLSPLMVKKIKREFRMLEPHTMTSMLAAIIHHELRHAVGRGSSTIDGRLDHYQDKGKPAENVWRTRDPEHQVFLNELKLTMPNPGGRSRTNQALSRRYDEILFTAHQPWSPTEPLVH